MHSQDQLDCLLRRWRAAEVEAIAARRHEQMLGDLANARDRGQALLLQRAADDLFQKVLDAQEEMREQGNVAQTGSVPPSVLLRRVF